MTDTGGKQNMSSYRMPECWWRTLVAVCAATGDGKYPQRTSAIMPWYIVSAGLKTTDETLRGRIATMAKRGLLDYTTDSDNDKAPRNYKLSREGLKALSCWEKAHAAGEIDTIITRDYLKPHQTATARFTAKNTKTPVKIAEASDAENVYQTFFKLPVLANRKQCVTAKTHPHLFRGAA